MTWIKNQAMSFTPYNFLHWLLIRRENGGPFLSKEDTIVLWFSERSTKAVVLDVDCDWYKIHLSSGVQSCVFLCRWIHELGISSPFMDKDPLYGQELEDILELLSIVPNYGSKYAVSKNELIS